MNNAYCEPCHECICDGHGPDEEYQPYPYPEYVPDEEYNPEWYRDDEEKNVDQGYGPENKQEPNYCEEPQPMQCESQIPECSVHIFGQGFFCDIQ